MKERKFNFDDCQALVEILASHETSILCTDWMKLYREWKEEHTPDFLIKVAIDCFCRFTLEEVSRGNNIEKASQLSEDMNDKLHTLVFETPVEEMPLYATNASTKNPEGIFAEWRLKIGK